MDNVFENFEEQSEEYLIDLYWLMISAINCLNFTLLWQLVEHIKILSLENRAKFFKIKEYENWYRTIMHSAFQVNREYFYKRDCSRICEHLKYYSMSQKDSRELNKVMVTLMRLGGSLAELDYYKQTPLMIKSRLHVGNSVVSNGFTKFAALWRGYKTRKTIDFATHSAKFSDTLDFVHELQFVPEGLYEVLPHGGVSYREGKQRFEQCVQYF